MKQMKRWTALLLTMLLLFTLAAPAALAAESTVTIKTVEDLMALSKNCTLDTWSQGKTVILANDLDLSGVDFTPIPTFGGTFQGDGHTISGLALTGSGNVRGLFRYLQSDATVKDLTVKGTIHPSDRQNELGLLAGSNAGRILNCGAEGTVMGDDRIGGLVGVNEADGELVSCTFSGSVTGKHSAGGIVGANHGTLTRCANSGSVDTHDLEDDPKTDYMDLAQLNSMDNVSAYTDIGGVVGLSDGTVQSCTNSGTVGSDQIGYNIGGIAGRSSGWLDGCTNTGAVYGRKDVGGIVGQLEPEVLQDFSDDFLDKLLNQMDALQDVLDRTTDHADSISDSLQAQMDDLSDRARDVKDIAGDLTDAMTDWANGNIDQINELSARISRSLDQLDDIMDDAAILSDDLEDLLDALEDVRRELKTAADDGSDAAKAFQDAAKALKSAADEIQRAMPGILSAMNDLVDAVNGGDAGEIMTALGELATALGGLDDAISDLSDAMEDLQRAMDSLKDISDALAKAMDKMDAVNKAANAVSAALGDITDGLKDMIHDLAKEPEIKIEPIGDDITGKNDQLQDALEALMDSGDALNSLMGDSADTLIADMRAISSQFRAITNLIRSEKTDKSAESGESLEDRVRDHFLDLSDNCTAENQHDGRISASENRGVVFGSSAVGGVVGAIGIEADLQPDDVEKVGDWSLDYTYQARALVTGCINSGAVTAKKDAVGGVAGQAYLGRIADCQGYGPVTSDGSYVGGIAGYSGGSVHAGWAKCAVSGEDYVGGIAGWADTLTDSHSLVTVTGSAYMGAIAGDVDKDGTVTDNSFTHDTLGGIDGISYAGKAEPVEFDALCALAGAPKGFDELMLTFRAEGQILATVPFRYGGGIDALPQIPAKEGHYAAWPELDYEHLTASQTLDAVYTPYSTAITDDGEALPQLLVDGSFSGRAVVRHTSEPVTFTDAKDRSHSGIAVTVTVEDPEVQEIAYTVHYRLTGSKRCALWVQTENGWEERTATLDGSYLLVPSDTAEITFCVEEKGASLALWIVLAAVLLVIAAIITAVLRKRGGSPLRRRLRALRQKRKTAARK